MPKLYILVGVPGSGKSTWASNQDWIMDCEYISTDQYVEAYARSVGKTYAEVFDFFMPSAVKLMSKAVIKARDQNKDIIWDQTSTTILSRKKKIDMLPDYYAIAIIFQTPSPLELNKRLSGRPGKIIPMEVVEKLMNTFEIPTKDEGFTEIWYA